MITVLRNPNGLPFLAGRNFTVMLSPVWRAFGPVLPIPLCARAVAEPSVITQSVVEPSGFLTPIVSDPWGFTNFTLSTDPDISISFFHVVHARERMMSLQRATGQQPAQRQISESSLNHSCASA